MNEIFDRFSLSNKVAVITGAGRGIGAGIARDFAGAGAKVVLAARRTHEIEAVAAEICSAGGEAIAVTTATSTSSWSASRTELRALGFGILFPKQCLH